MQTPDRAAAAATVQRQQWDQALAAAVQRDYAKGLFLLREAVLRLTQQAVCEPSLSAPTSRLAKLRPDDNMEAYLEVFERTAQWESWPEDQWAHILSPFLTGPAQQASQDLMPERASQYPVLKQAILAYYGHSLAARAQCFHDWRFDIRSAVQTQISQHGWLIRRWLTAREGPSLLDLVLIDNTIRQLPPDTRRTLAHNHPDTVDELVGQLENWQAAQQLSFSTLTPL